MTGTITYRAKVYEWTGPLTGNGGGATGSVLFDSGPLTITDAGDGAVQTVTVNTGGVALAADGHYVAFLTTVDADSLAANSGSEVVFNWRAKTFDNRPAGNGGGGFVYFTGAASISDLTSFLWETSNDDGDLTWTANFSAPAVPVPEPSAVGLLGGLGMVGAAALRLRRVVG